MMTRKNNAAMTESNDNFDHVVIYLIVRMSQLFN